jgi:Tfp pilus assembly protein PilV
MVKAGDVRGCAGLRAGFSLAEALVALVLVGVAVLSLGGAAHAAARLLREAAMTQGATLEAEAALDSLTSARVTGGNVFTRGPYTFSWNASDSIDLHRLELTVRYPGSHDARVLTFSRITTPAPAQDSIVH